MKVDMLSHHHPRMALILFKKVMQTAPASSFVQITTVHASIIIYASVKWNMCKHIHLVCRPKFSIVQAESSNINNPNSLQGDLLIDEDETRTRETDIIITELSEKKKK
ncbi:hypothetical protein TNCT_489611 [Trichonephila clavata]|uniref:Uncharacterized protein n=1 Tax=Trichonephila clavata TaxID=2740835 RepID=A0A8X6HTG2_TRICU|nr:hypothetical protein TNCT_489611 [Trichonephila clavata]